ncbi:MAG: DUF3048 domain-containing protein [Ilumatobacteraceae bacterium]
MHLRTPVVVVVLTGFALVGCSGSDGAATPDTTVAASTTTAAAPVTTVVVDTTVPSTEAAATSVPVAATVMPLTGLPITEQGADARPALVAKIDNHPQARPQFGLNSADIVFEEDVENLTRFAAVYQSTVPERVGPVRSGRTQDVDLLGSLAKPMFVWSGGNPNVTRAINASDLVSLSPSSTNNVGFFRDRRGNEKPEHTLYARPTEMYATFWPLFAPAPKQQFQYRADGAAPAGTRSGGVNLAMDNVDVDWVWDVATSSYLRSQDGKPHQDAELGQVNAANVVVLEVVYQPSPADARSPEAQTVGTGIASVFTAGSLVTGTWERNDRLEPFVLTADDGSIIELTPGRTWVELARKGKTTPA